MKVGYHILIYIRIFLNSKLVNPTMTIEEFKIIFYWEYFHRLLGRIIGLVYLIPL